MGRGARATPPTPTDAEVVERARGGDREAFGLLVERYQGRVYHLALRVLRDEEQARDAVQDAFLKVYGSLHRFEGRSSFYTWLYRLVLNLCLDAKRRDRSGREVEWTEERTPELAQEAATPRAAGWGGGPEAALARAELREAIDRAVADLPEEARRTLQLREVDGLSYAEIARSLGIPRGTVMSRLHYARRRLRAALVEAGAVDPERAGRGAESAGEDR